MNPPDGHRELLDPEFLLNAYCSGFFPMAEAKLGEIRWYSPDPRAIIDIEAFKPPRSLRATMRKGIFEIRWNTAFERVIRGCADRDETWISEEIVRAYRALHRLGYAHSVEAWARGGLAGGLYGVAVGGAFFGESMFSRVTDASKIALAALVQRLRERGFVLLDTQFLTPHLGRFGGREIPRAAYLARLAMAIRTPCTLT